MKKAFLFLLLGSCIILLYRSLFGSGFLASGDWHFIFSTTFSKNILGIWAWDPSYSNGFGGSDIFVLGLNSYFINLSHILLNVLYIPWFIVERSMWFWPMIIISSFSSFYLYRSFFKSNFAFLAAFLFVSNTYELMLIGGGQVGVAIGVSLAPLLLGLYIELIQSSPHKPKVYTISSLGLCAMVLALEISFDLRITYITLCVLSLFSFFFLKNVFRVQTIALLFSTFVIAFLLNFYWIFPQLLLRQNPITVSGSAYSNASSVTFFSFANFENALGLLHPNWPENIFGKVGFMKPEFLLLPLLAYGALFFIKRKTENMKQKRENTYVLFFALLGLIGVFLAKGANDPFGGVYLWMFNHVPGFIMFRDPTKWYLLIVLSYSVLIPFTVGKMYAFLKEKKFLIKFKIFNVPNVFLIGVLLYLLFLIRPALLGQLGGTFKGHQVPSDYVKLEKFLDSQQGFSRTFWVPTTQRFGFFSITHPAIAAEDFFHVTSLSGVIHKLQSHQPFDKLRLDSLSLLQNAGVKYVIVPYDSENEIFLKDRKYDNSQYLGAVNSLRKISYLNEIPGFGKIHVFEVSHPKDHFFLVGTGTVTYKNINPTKYEVSLKDVTKGQRLVFSEGYDMYWVAEQQTQDTGSKPYESLFNSFVLPKSGDYTLTITYAPQKWVDVGLWVSGLTLLGIVGFFLLFLKRSAKLQ